MPLAEPSMLTGIDTITSEIPIAPLFSGSTCIHVNDDNHALRRPHRNLLLVWRKFSTLTEKTLKCLHCLEDLLL